MLHYKIIKIWIMLHNINSKYDMLYNNYCNTKKPTGLDTIHNPFFTPKVLILSIT